MKTLTHVLAAGLSLAAIVPAQNTPFSYPDTPVGKIARSFVTMLDSVDEAAAREFINTQRSAGSLERSPVSKQLATFRQLQTVLGGLEPHSVRGASAYELTLIGRAKNLEAWFEVGLRVEAAPPHKLDGLSVKPTAAPSMPDVDYDDWTDLHDLLRQVRDDYRLPGIAAAVVDRTGIRSRAVVGVRRLGDEEALTAADRFHIGSVTKSMTATLIGVLVDRGKLRFDQTLGDVMPDVPMLPAYRSATIAQVLQHIAGIQPYVVDEADEARPPADLPPMQQRARFAELVLQEPALHAPGSAFTYSNAGYAIAGHIAERVTGRAYEELLSELIFTPLAMRRSGFGPPRNDGRSKQPSGHTGDFDALQPDPLDADPIADWLAPAGDVHTSISDLARYARAHLVGLAGDTTVVEAATMRRLHATAPGQGYACGWMLEAGRHHHSGSTGSFYATVALAPDAGHAVVVLINAGSMSLGAATDKVVEAIERRARSRTQ